MNLGFAAENEAETPLRRLAETPSTRFCPLAHHAHSPLRPPAHSPFTLRPLPLADRKPLFLLEFSQRAPRQSKCRLMRILTPLFSVLLFVSVQAVAQSMPILNFNMTKADGTQVVYEFRVPDNVVFSSFADTAEAQHQAGVTALTWAQSFYGAHDVFLQSVDFKALPIPHYVATFNGQIGTIRQTFFAVILGSGTPLEPAQARMITQKTTGAANQRVPKPTRRRETVHPTARSEGPAGGRGTRDLRDEEVTPAARPHPNVWVSGTSN